MGMIEYENKLSSYLFNKTRRGLLALLFSHADESFYVNQIMQLLNSGSGAIQRELKIMTEAGIVTRDRKANLVYYRADSNSPIFNELKSIIGKTSVVVDIPARFKVTEKRLARFCHKHHIIKLSLFGSVLRNDFGPDSDVDVLVEFEPGHVPGFGIVDIEKELSEIIGRKVDLRTSKDLSRFFREQVVREAEVRYAAT
jgi:hypothetical protein